MQSKGEKLRTVLNLISSFDAEEVNALRTLLDTLDTEEKKEGIPVSIFSTSLTPLEALCKFFVEEQKMTYHAVASILHRDDGVIGVTYRRARVKIKKPLPLNGEHIPVDIFSRRLSAFESVVLHLQKKHSVKELASLFKRSYHTIWTVMKRAKQKTKKKYDK